MFIDPEYKRGLAEQIASLRTRWPQAHVDPPKSGSIYDEHLVVLPGMPLPAGWNKTICTALFLARVWGDKVASPINGFYVDLPDLRLAPSCAMPHYSRAFPENPGELKGFPQWRELTRFWWRQQHFNPNKQSLYTSAMVVRERLKVAR